MSGSSDVIEFGFDDGKIIKPSGLEQFKLSRAGEKARISLCAFKKLSDGVIVQKSRERWDGMSEEERQGKTISTSLTDAEKLDLVQRVDKKIAERLGKPVEEVREIDRLDITNPRFWMGFSHYKDGVGTIRCLGKYNGSTLVTPGRCCNEIGEADQHAVTAIIQYPVAEHLQVNAQLFKERQYTYCWMYKMSAKQFKRLEGTFVEARAEGRSTMDLKVTLDGDPKFKKHLYESASCVWAKEDMDPDTRAWVLDQGLRAAKHCQGSLGMEITEAKLLEKLGKSPAALSSGAAEAAPRANMSYSGLLD